MWWEGTSGATCPSPTQHSLGSTTQQGCYAVPGTAVTSNKFSLSFTSYAVLTSVMRVLWRKGTEIHPEESEGPIISYTSKCFARNCAHCLNSHKHNCRERMQVINAVFCCWCEPAIRQSEEPSASENENKQLPSPPKFLIVVKISMRF